MIKHSQHIIRCLLVMLTFSFVLLNAIPLMASDTADNSDFLHISDNADIFSPEEIEDLMKQCQSISDEAKIDVIILTEEHLDVSRKQYIEDFYDSLYPAISDAVILLLNMDQNDRGVEIQGYGSCEYTISDKRIETIIAAILPYLSNEEYYNAMIEFIRTSESCFDEEPDSNYKHTEKDNQIYEDRETYDEGSDFVKQSLINFFIALAIGAVSVFIMAYNSGGKMTANQSTYLDSGHSRILGRYDRYIRTTTSRRPKPKPPENNSGGGGVSSGGHSHSGGGSSF